jgi:hypothetical protein
MAALRASERNNVILDSGGLARRCFRWLTRCARLQAVEHGDGRTIGPQHNLGHIALHFILIGVVARLKTALDVNPAALFKYCSVSFTRPGASTLTRCHSVFSLRSPLVLSFHVS